MICRTYNATEHSKLDKIIGTLIESNSMWPGDVCNWHEMPFLRNGLISFSWKK